MENKNNWISNEIWKITKAPEEAFREVLFNEIKEVSWDMNDLELEELARIMLNENYLPKYFWADAVSTTYYVLNKVIIRPILKLTPYKIWKGRKQNISHLKVFECKYFVLNNRK